MRAARPLGVIAAAAATAAAILTACAADRGGARMASYGEEVERLRADCEARGGMLIPGRMTGRPALDYPCRISNPPAAQRRD